MPPTTTQQPNLVVQFLLHQLVTHEQNRERFNLVNPFLVQLNYDEYHQLRLYILNKREDVIINSAGEISDFTIHKWFDYFSVIIRTCLSRVNGQAILGVFEGNLVEYANFGAKFGNPVIILQNKEMPAPAGYEWNNEFNTLNELYEAFDYPIRHGYDNHTALQALHDKMLELVPEYREFLNNNNK